MSEAPLSDAPHDSGQWRGAAARTDHWGCAGWPTQGSVTLPHNCGRAALLLAATCMGVFIVLAVCQAQGLWITRLDLPVTEWMTQRRSDLVSVCAWVFTHAGGVIGLTSATVGACLLLWWRGLRLQGWVLAGTMVCSSTTTVILKLIFARLRPDTDFVAGHILHSYSFPSGHSFNSAAFCLTLAACVLLSASRRAWRIAATVLACAATIGVGVSRIYLGYHWMTDVLAGWSLGVMWACCAWWMMLYLMRRRALAQVTNSSTRTRTPALHAGVG